MKIVFEDRPKAGGGSPVAIKRASTTDQLIADLVRSAPDGAAAWERLCVGVENERRGDVEDVVPYLMSPERVAANGAALELDHKIAAGWGFIGGKVDAGQPVPRSWIGRLVELHEKSQDRLFELDAVRRREWEAGNGARPERERRYVPGVFADVLHRAAVEAEGYLKGLTPGAPVNLALTRLGQAIDDGDIGAARLWAREYVAHAVRQRFGGNVDESA